MSKRIIKNISLVVLLLCGLLSMTSCIVIENTHIHTPCSICGLCDHPNCNGMSSEKCTGHLPEHEHIECPICGLCTDSNCDGKDIEKCSGHNDEGHKHIKCITCGLCIDSNCDGEENERCEWHLSDHYHIECPICGLCTDSECDGKTIEKCSGHPTGKLEKFNSGVYSYEFDSKTFEKHQTLSLDSIIWTLSGNYDDEVGYWGYHNTKGQQFGSAVYAYRNMFLTSNNFADVTKIIVYASGAKNTKTQLTVTVGGVQVGETVTLTSVSSQYVFNSLELLSGDVVLNFTQDKNDSSVAIYVKSISVTCGEIDENPEVSKPETEEEIVINNKYAYTFDGKMYSGNETKDLGGISWTLDGTGGNSWGYDGTNGRGQQFGSSNAPYTSMSFVSTEFKYVTSIKINTSGASNTNAVLKVYVGNTQVGEDIYLTKDATEYTINMDKPISGAVKFEYSQTSEKAIYIKSIEIETFKAVATSEDEIYALLEANNDYIIIANDIVVDSLVIVGYTVTLDLDGHTISASEDRDGDHSTYGIFAKDGANVTITGNGTIYGGTGGWWNIALRASGENAVINVLNGTVYSGPNEGDQGENGNSTLFVRGTNCAINIYDGLFYTEASYDNIYFVFNVAAESHGSSYIKVYGGTFVNANPENQGIMNIAGGKILADGLTVKVENVGTDKHYVVIEK